jgi:hypothetical protein
MATIARFYVETWGDKFIVVGEFLKHTLVSRIEFSTYGEAMNEISKLARREAIRDEADSGRGFNR